MTCTTMKTVEVATARICSSYAGISCSYSRNRLTGNNNIEGYEARLARRLGASESSILADLISAVPLYEVLESTINQ